MTGARKLGKRPETMTHILTNLVSHEGKNEAFCQ